jgi:hypothetical protein
MLWQNWSQQGLNAMGKPVADIIAETLQSAGAKHCFGVKHWRSVYPAAP